MNTQATMDYTPDEPEDKQPRQNTGNHPDPMEQVSQSDPETESAETGTDLVAIEKYDMVKLFSDGGADALLDDIEKQAESIVPDITTEKGRKAIASMAYKVSTSKTTLDKAGKTLKEKAQQTVNEVDAERKKIRDRMDALRDKVRKPLTEFENREKERVAEHNRVLEKIREGASFDHTDPEVVTIAGRIDDLASAYNRNWEEFTDHAKSTFDQTAERLNEMLNARKKRDEEKAELERLRKEKEERERQEREEQLQKEAAEKARIEAEEKAAREKAEAEAKAKAEQERVEREKAAAEEAAKAAESARVAAEEQSKREKEEAERKAKEAAERAEREKQEAIEAERKRQADEKAREEAERQKREADKAHHAKINNEAFEDILKAGAILDEKERAKAIVTAIAQGKIRNVKINY